MLLKLTVTLFIFLKFLNFKFISCMSMSVCLHMYMFIMFTSCPQTAKEGIRFPTTGVEVVVSLCAGDGN